VAATQSQIAHALVIQFGFIHHKPVMMHEFHDHLVRDSRRARTQPCSSSAQYRCPLSPRGSTVSSPKAVKAPTRIRSEHVSGPGKRRLPACWFRVIQSHHKPLMMHGETMVFF